MRYAYLVLMLLTVPCISKAQSACDVIAGASLVAKDGTFLGRFGSQYANDSLLNQYSVYGSQYSQTSIWDEYGRYGGEYSEQSPFNVYSFTPPMIIKNGEVIGYLTVNTQVSNSLNPYVAKACRFI
jgi:hypothetical protein